MNKLFSSVLLLCLITIIMPACKSGFEYNKTGFLKLNDELKKEFGKDTWYTDLQIVSNRGSDDAVLITETKDPASMKQEQWAQYHGTWEKQADVSFTSAREDPSAFMFQLDKEVSLSTLADLLEKSKIELKDKQHIDSTLFVMAAIKSDNRMNTKKQGIHYFITLRSAADQKDYAFKYDLNGKAMETE